MKQLAIAFCTTALFVACNAEEKKSADAATGETKVASMTTDGKTGTGEWIPVDSAAAEKAWREGMTPGPQHAMMAKSNGVWNAETTMWMEAGGKAETSTGTAVNKMILGGRYQQSSFKGTMMGQTFEGVATTGYDNARKLYVSNWVDNMGTAMLNMEGSWDEASKSITMTGKMYCAANKKDCQMREVFKMVDDNTQVMEMYGPDMKTGKEYKNMEIKYTRKK